MKTKSTEQKKPASKLTIGIVVPLLNEEDSIPDLVTQLDRVLQPLGPYELLLVDDGSTDSSIDVIKDLAGRRDNVRFISLTRNFGHQVALKTGLENCHSDIVISMDADLQHPPAEIPRMIDAWRKGHMVVNMIRDARGNSLFKRATSSLFYKMINSISDFQITPGSSDFRLLDKSVVDLIRSMPEHCIFLRGFIPWLGFKQVDLSYDLAERQHGKRKYRLFKMLQLAVTGIISSSIRPLRIAFVIGTVTSSIAVMYAIYALIIRVFYDVAITGWASLLIGMMLLGGVQLLMLGVIGEYVGRVFLEVKGRPDSVIAESNID